MPSRLTKKIRINPSNYVGTSHYLDDPSRRVNRPEGVYKPPTPIPESDIRTNSKKVYQRRTEKRHTRE